MEKQIREAIIAELSRQAEARPQALKVNRQGDRISVNGEINIDELVMVVAGSIAGGP